MANTRTHEEIWAAINEKRAQQQALARHVGLVAAGLCIRDLERASRVLVRLGGVEADREMEGYGLKLAELIAYNGLCYVLTPAGQAALNRYPEAVNVGIEQLFSLVEEQEAAFTMAAGAVAGMMGTEKT